MRVLALISRILFSLVFFATGLGDFLDGAINYAGARGVPLPYLLVPLSGMISVLGASSILLGFKAKTGAWFIILFVLPVTFITNKFWIGSNPAQVMVMTDTWILNLSMLIGGLFTAFFGAGQMSYDSLQGASATGETKKIDFNYPNILNSHNRQFFTNDHSL